MVFPNGENTKILPSASGNSRVMQAERNDARTVIQHSPTRLPVQTASPCCLSLHRPDRSILLPSGSFSAEEQKRKTLRKAARYRLCLCDYVYAFTLEFRSQDNIIGPYVLTILHNSLNMLVTH